MLAPNSWGREFESSGLDVLRGQKHLYQSTLVNAVIMGYFDKTIFVYRPKKSKNTIETRFLDIADPTD